MAADTLSETPLRAGVLTELSVPGRRLRTMAEALVRNRGLALARARRLLPLRQPGAARQSELAAVLELEHPTVVRRLDRLEQQGLIARHPVDGDRRAARTAAGRCQRGGAAGRKPRLRQAVPAARGPGHGSRRGAEGGRPRR
jgi:MarR family transcriptional regulator for hemolysin